MTKSTSRIEKIFQMFDKGMSSREINERRDAGQMRANISRKKGDESEKNAQRALDSLYYVNNVRINPKNGNHDYLSHDLTIHLDDISCISILASGLAIPHATLFAQVVSSQAGIDHYKRETIDRLDSGEDEYYAYLVREKLVVLDGHLPDEIIQECFAQQLAVLNIAWATR